jgi:hypothetical protein
MGPVGFCHHAGVSFLEIPSGIEVVTKTPQGNCSINNKFGNPFGRMGLILIGYFSIRRSG